MVAEIIEIDGSCGQILKLNTFNPDLQVLDLTKNKNETKSTDGKIFDLDKQSSAPFL